MVDLEAKCGTASCRYYSLFRRENYARLIKLYEQYSKYPPESVPKRLCDAILFEKEVFEGIRQGMEPKFIGIDEEQ